MGTLLWASGAITNDGLVDDGSVAQPQNVLSSVSIASPQEMDIGYFLVEWTFKSPLTRTVLKATDPRDRL